MGSRQHGDQQPHSSPATEIYPTPSQLPPYVISSPYDVDKLPRDQPWPLSLRGELGVYSTGKDVDYRTVMTIGPQGFTKLLPQPGLPARELSCGNQFCRPAGTLAGFSRIIDDRGSPGKYTSRQLDSIVAQILSIGSKAISSDFPYTSGDVGEQIGHRFMVAPYVFPGWLSRQWVNGVGRSTEGYPTVHENRGVSSGRNLGPGKPEEYTPARGNSSISGSSGGCRRATSAGTKVLPLQASRFFVGHALRAGVLNVIDFASGLTEPSGQTVCGAPSPNADPDSSATYCFWADQLLQNHQGIDFAGNPGVTRNSRARSRPATRQKKYHDPFARINPASAGPWKYKGSRDAPMAG